MSYVYGLGADTVQVGARNASILDHSLIKFRAKPPYLRLVTSLPAANDYAAGGFHVAVSRGLAGGCSDLSTAFNGTGPSSCRIPLTRPDLTVKWKAAAQAYYDAYQRKNLADMLTGIRVANEIANAAFAAEGISPPRDPVTGAKEPPAIAPGPVGGGGGAGLFGSLGEAGLPVLAVAGLGAWYLFGGGKKKGKRKARKGGKRKVRRSRRRR